MMTVELLETNYRSPDTETPMCRGCLTIVLPTEWHLDGFFCACCREIRERRLARGLKAFDPSDLRETPAPRLRAKNGESRTKKRVN